MMPVPNFPVPLDEQERLAALKAAGVLDCASDPIFDDLVKMAALICQTPVALVSFLDVDKQVLKARVGLNTCSTSRDVAFCAHAIVQKEMFIVPDTHADPRFRDNPLVLGSPFIRFYAGMPVIHAVDGVVLGTVCVIDRVKRTLSAEQCDALKILSRQISVHLGYAIARSRPTVSYRASKRRRQAAA